MGWQRRGNGRVYNSRSGHGVLVGKESGNLVRYGSGKSNCNQCEVNQTNGVMKQHNKYKKCPPPNSLRKVLFDGVFMGHYSRHFLASMAK